MVKLLEIDVRIHEHPGLGQDDKCFFLHEYAARQNWDYGVGNQIITNLKKSPLKKDLPEYYYKRQTIQRCALELLSAAGKEWLSQFTLMPIPPSKHRDHEEYDDRMLQVLRAMGPFDIRELVCQIESITPFHHGERLGVSDLARRYAINEDQCEKPVSAVLVCDDVLTNGTHFKAAERVLQKRFGPIRVEGLFIARCVHPDPQPQAADGAEEAPDPTELADWL